MHMSAEKNAEPSPRWSMLRDLAILQVKLIVDGFRDLLLLPASMFAVVISLIRTENGVPGPEFYRLLVLGKQIEQWINLFGAVKNAPAGVDNGQAFGDVELDDIVSRVETFVVDEYQRGGVTAQAKSRIDAALNAMRRKAAAKADDMPEV